MGLGFPILLSQSGTDAAADGAAAGAAAAAAAEAAAAAASAAAKVATTAQLQQQHLCLKKISFGP